MLRLSKSLLSIVSILVNWLLTHFVEAALFFLYHDGKILLNLLFIIDHVSFFSQHSHNLLA